MASLDDSSERIITVVVANGSPVEIPFSFLPENSLWGSAMAGDTEATEVEFPAFIETPDGKMKVPEWLRTMTFDFLEIMGGKTYPVFGVENVRTGVKQIDIKTQALVNRKVYGLDPAPYVGAEASELVKDLTLPQLVDLKLLAIYLGFNDFNDLGSVKIATLLNGMSYADQRAFLDNKVDENGKVVERSEAGRLPD